jgi:hypothetical protein
MLYAGIRLSSSLLTTKIDDASFKREFNEKKLLRHNQ